VVRIQSGWGVATGVFQCVINAISSLAAPVFFAISGYLVFRGSRAKTMLAVKKQCKKLLILGLVALAVLWVLGLFTAGFAEAIDNFTLKNFINLVLFNNVAFFHYWGAAAILWFVFALVYILAIFYLWLQRKGKPRTIIILALTGFFLWLLFDSLYTKNFGFSVFPLCLERSWVGQGLIFFSIGYFIHQYQPIIQQKFTVTHRRLFMLSATILFIFEQLAYFVPRGVERGNYMAFGFTLPILTAAIMLWAMHTKATTKKGSGRIVKMISFLGGHISLYIFLSHQAIKTFAYYYLNQELGNGKMYEFSRFWQLLLFFVAICAASLFCGLIYYYSKKFIVSKVKIKKRVAS
jgi:surface polysaccharide O-acyltransferase-like enzyme